ncbi:MAG: TRAP transporter small permease [Methylococcales bacterium]|nr:TRAP transporter small permease [Methylococcales bacterium]
MIYKIYNFLLKAETGILILILVSMIITAVIQIVMRNFFASGIFWIDSFVRIAVLWLALVGAMVASRNDKHIAIDIIFRFINEKMQTIAKRITALFTSLVCFVVTYYSIKFVKYEYGDGGLAFANIPNWFCESIIPVAFFIMGLRYFFSAVFNLRHPV